MSTRPTGADWIGVEDGELPLASAIAWAIQPGTGALVTFYGTVRDHSEGRDGVEALEYDAYLEQVEPRLEAVARGARARWPAIARLVLLHRVGRLELGEVSVCVAVSTPHRGEAFEAARYCIDTLKVTVPIWKREIWSGGADWARGGHEVVEVVVEDVASP